MPFSFLNPWLWLGALALAAPVWLHLRRRKETNLALFSTLRFLDDNPEPRQSPMRLQDLLLFILRALALLLIVGAFAWPFLKGAGNTPVRESRVYILDNTLSHRVNNGFERDRDRLVAELNAADPTVQIAVVELTGSPRTLVGFGDDREAAKQRLKDLKPSFQRGSYLAAFRQANGLINNSLGEKKRIILLGDGQENQWSENTSTPAFLRNVTVELPKIAAENQPDISLSDPRVQRIFMGEKSLVNFTVRLAHSGPAKAATVTLRANGQIIFNRQMDLGKEAATTMLQAQWESPPNEWLRGEVAAEAEPDALRADDRVFFSLPPVVEGTVAVLAQSSFLRVALSPDIMRGQWAARFIEPSQAGQELAASSMADVLCLESGYLQSAEVRKLASRYLSNGHGVLLMINRLTPTITGALRELGLEVSRSQDTSDKGAEKLAFVAANHPVFHPFVSPEYGNLIEVEVGKYARIRSSDAMPLVFSERGAGLFFQSTRFPGKLFVAAFGLDREHTTWPVHPTFIPFLDLTLQSARADDPTPSVFEPGQVGLCPCPPSEVLQTEEGQPQRVGAR